MWVEISSREIKKNDKIKHEIAILGNLPIKHDDPGMFFISCSIGSRKFEHAMLDLRSTINILSIPIYFEFNLISYTLLIYCCSQPISLWLDLLVWLGVFWWEWMTFLFLLIFMWFMWISFFLPTDLSILLRRPFLNIAKPVIDVDEIK